MSKGRSTVVLQRTKTRVGPSYVTCCGCECSARSIFDVIVASGGDGSVDIRSGCRGGIIANNTVFQVGYATGGDVLINTTTTKTTGGGSRMICSHGGIIKGHGGGGTVTVNPTGDLCVVSTDG